MVECSTDKTRDEIRAYAEGLIAKKDTVEVQIDDAASGRKAHFQMVDGQPIMLNFQTFMDLEMDAVKEFFKDYAGNLQKIINENATFTKLDETINGRTIAHHRVVPGVPLVSARSLICTYYPIEEGENFIFMVSSQGNE